MHLSGKERARRKRGRHHEKHFASIHLLPSFN
jgi:hypothetical protein